MEEYRTQTRGGKGLITYRIAEKTGPLVRIALVDDDKDVLLINDSGIVIRLAAVEIPVLSRVTQGVTLMRTRAGKVVDLAVLDHEDVEEGDEDYAPEDPMDSSEVDAESEAVSGEDTIPPVNEVDADPTAE